MIMFYWLTNGRAVDSNTLFFKQAELRFFVRSTSNLNLNNAALQAELETQTQ